MRTFIGGKKVMQDRISRPCPKGSCTNITYCQGECGLLEHGFGCLCIEHRGMRRNFYSGCHVSRFCKTRYPEGPPK